MSQAPLFTFTDMLAHGASTDLLDGYRVKPIEVTVETGGALGEMTVKWRPVGQSDWSAADPSDPGTTWVWAPRDPAFAVLTFSTATYTAGDSWTVTAAGTVVPQGSAPATLAVTRTNVVDSVIAGVTSDIVTWCQPNAVPPVISIGEGMKSWASTIAIWRLKLRSGVTPSEAGSGDAMLMEEARRCEERFRAVGASANRPPDLIDSSSGGGTAGAGLPHLPRSRSSRGFGDFS